MDAYGEGETLIFADLARVQAGYRRPIFAVNNTEPRIKSIRITEDLIIADLFDGRTISVPLVWSWRLFRGKPPAQREKL